ncbi:hypothetical protein WICPIJ_002938, partial [Wickerhamomyces pijperi]
IEEVFVIGGAELYNQVLKNDPELIERVFLTEVSAEKELEMDAFIELLEPWKRQEPHVWTAYLATKGLDAEFAQHNNEAGFRFSYQIYSPSRS